MDQCVVDTSTTELILMIGGQVLLLAIVLFIIFYGKMPIAFPLAPLAPLVETVANLGTTTNATNKPNVNNSKK